LGEVLRWDEITYLSDMQSGIQPLWLHSTSQDRERWSSLAYTPNHTKNTTHKNLHYTV